MQSPKKNKTTKDNEPSNANTEFINQVSQGMQMVNKERANEAPANNQNQDQNYNDIVNTNESTQNNNTTKLSGQNYNSQANGVVTSQALLDNPNWYKEGMRTDDYGDFLGIAYEMDNEIYDTNTFEKSTCLVIHPWFKVKYNNILTMDQETV